MKNENRFTEIYTDEENDIHHSASVHHNVKMGRGNVIMEGVIIREGVELGNNNYIGPNCIIGDFPEKNGFMTTPGKVLIGHNNRFTKQVTIDAGTERPTVIQNDTLFLKNAHVGHDAIIRDLVTLSCNVCIGGFTEVGKETNFGLGAVAHQRLKIAERCMIGMNSTVTKKTKTEYCKKYAGSPARDIGSNKIKETEVAGDANTDC